MSYGKGVNGAEKQNNQGGKVGSGGCHFYHNSVASALLASHTLLRPSLTILY